MSGETTDVLGVPLSLIASSVVMFVMVLGDGAASQMMVVMVAVVAAMALDERLTAWTAPAAGAGPDQ